MKISTRLVILAVSTVSLAVVVAASMVWQDYQQTEQARRLDTLHTIREDIDNLHSQLSTYSINGDLTSLNKARQTHKTLSQQLPVFLKTTDTQPAPLKKLAGMNTEIARLLDKMHDTHQHSKPGAQTVSYQHLSRETNRLLQAMIENSIHLEREVISDSKQQDTETTLFTGGLLLALTLLLSSLTLRTSNLFKIRIALLDQGIKKLSEGDSLSRINLDARDEISEVAKHFNNMTDKLRETTISRDQLQAEVAHRTRELLKQKKILKQLADHDSLTELPNRAYFHNNLLSTIRKSLRQNSTAAVLFIDLDKFKQINDSLGHHIGDEVLQEVSRRFRQRLRNSDFIARLGGDEFTVIIDPLDSPQAAAEIARQLLHCMHQPCQLKEHTLHLSISIGISILPQDGTDVSSLMKNADLAMYKAKERGGNLFHFYSEDMTLNARHKMAMEEELHRALKRGELRVYYQPQYSLKTQQLVGMEGLVRWIHPEKGLIPPMEFIPLAEERGLIHELGLQVLEIACQQCANWLASGFDPGILAINVSTKQLNQSKLPELILGVLDRTGWPAERLELEVTESFFIKDPQTSLLILDQLRELGIALAIDDFGTGYSSLSYLKQLPVSKLKIDRSFMQNLTQGSEDRAISEAIIALGRGLGLKVIAEGVELADQAEVLTREGCDQAQGYLYGKPMPAAEFSRLIPKKPDHPA
ncbi:MAG: EAL domain-containing protein [Pontibacterium sp.]